MNILLILISLLLSVINALPIVCDKNISNYTSSLDKIELFYDTFKDGIVNWDTCCKESNSHIKVLNNDDSCIDNDCVEICAFSNTGIRTYILRNQINNPIYLAYEIVFDMITHGGEYFHSDYCIVSVSFDKRNWLYLYWENNDVNNHISYRSIKRSFININPSANQLYIKLETNGNTEDDCCIYDRVYFYGYKQLPTTPDLLIPWCSILINLWKCNILIFF